MYVNPEAAAAQSVANQQQQNEAVELLTQTVYGFLDFTTTIGNTVMVFSPQSALSGTEISGYFMLIRDRETTVDSKFSDGFLSVMLCHIFMFSYKE